MTTRRKQPPLFPEPYLTLGDSMLDEPNVRITQAQLDKLKAKWGASVAVERIEQFSRQKAAHGYKYVNDFMAMIQWFGKETAAARPACVMQETALCTLCETPHEWRVRDPYCGEMIETACPQFAQTLKARGAKA